MATKTTTIVKLEALLQNLQTLHNQAMQAGNAGAMAQATAQIKTTTTQLAQLRNAQIADDDAQLNLLDVQLDQATAAAQAAMQNLANLGKFLGTLSSAGQTITQIASV